MQGVSPRIESYDLRDVNGIRWWRLRFAPLDFLIDPGIWIRDTRVIPPAGHGIDPNKGVRIGNYRVKLALPQLYFDHGRPVAPWIIRRWRRVANPS